MREKLKAFLKQPRGVFVSFLLIYTASWGGHFTTGDGYYKREWAKALLFRGSSDLDPGPGVVHSMYGIGQTLLAMPGLAAAHWINQTTGIRCEAALYTFLFVLNGAFFLTLVARYLLTTYSVRRVWAILLVLGLATTWWPHTKLDVSEALVLTFFFWGFLFIREDKLVRGTLLASAAVLIREDAVSLMAILGAWALWNTRRLSTAWTMALASIPAIALELFSNYLRYETWWPGSGYSGYGFSNPFLVGLSGILFSAGKSVFAFSPPLLLGFLGWRRFRASPSLSRDAALFLAVFAVQLAMYSKWWDWSGDDSWGVRFMIPGVLLMCLPGIELLDRRALAIPIVTAGVLVQLLGVLICPLDYVLMVHTYNPQRRSLYVGDGYKPVDIEDVRYNPRYSQLAGHWWIIRSKLGFAPTGTEKDEQTGTPLSQAFPPGTPLPAWDFIWLRRR